MSTLKTDTLSNVAGSKSVPMATVVDGSAKAWVQFLGAGTVTIRAAFNVSSITDIGVGEWKVVFATAMSDANYAAVAAFQSGAGGNILDVNSYSTTGFTVKTVTGAGAAGSDSGAVSAVAFR